jgi:CBS domain-containing protein
MQAKDLMTRNPACCTPETSLQEVARMMVDCNCGEIPVVDNHESMRPIGAITDRDITCRSIAKGLNPLNMTAGDCMTSPCVTITLEASLEDCCRLMEENMIRRIPVVDGSGRCCGIVSQADIAQKMDHIAAEVLRQVSQPTDEASLVGRRHVRSRRSGRED